MMHSAMAEACTLKLKKMKNKCFAHLPPGEKSVVATPTLPLCQLLGIFSAQPLPKVPPVITIRTWLGAGGCSLVPVCHTQPALPMHLQYLHQGQHKRARKLRVRKRTRRRKMIVRKGVGKIDWSLMIQGKITLILTNHYDICKYVPWPPSRASDSNFECLSLRT